MKLLVTAGPTREPIDAVRFISNRSSGQMGLAAARAAADAGHAVTLLLGPTDAPVDLPASVRVYRFGSAAELKQLLEAHFRDCDALVMAAAVSDYRPQQVLEGKTPRQELAGLAGDAARGGGLTLHLAPTPDLVAIMAGLRRPGQVVVAFALEEAQHLEGRALAKLRRKGVDAIVANPLGTMEAGAITGVWFTAAGERAAPGRMGKAEFGRWLVERVADLWQSRGAGSADE